MKICWKIVFFFIFLDKGGQFQTGSSVPALLCGGKIVVVQVFIKQQKIHLQELSASMNPKYYDIALILQNIYNFHVKTIIVLIEIIWWNKTFGAPKVILVSDFTIYLFYHYYWYLYSILHVFFQKSFDLNRNKIYLIQILISIINNLSNKYCFILEHPIIYHMCCWLRFQGVYSENLLFLFL